jgi:hypothetical protein
MNTGLDVANGLQEASVDLVLVGIDGNIHGLNPRFGISIDPEKIRYSIAILLQRPVYCFWRADFHGQGATLVTPDTLMDSLPTILPCCSGRSGVRYFK